MSTALRAVKITKSTALAHLAKEVSKEDGRRPLPSSACACSSERTWASCTACGPVSTERPQNARTRHQDALWRRSRLRLGERPARSCIEPSPASSDDMCIPPAGSWPSARGSWFQPTLMAEHLSAFPHNLHGFSPQGYQPGAVRCNKGLRQAKPEYPK